MREIKFRAWDKKLKRIFNPVKGCDLLIGIDGKLFVNIDNKENVGIMPVDLQVMQYTGLKDKNKNLTNIYEYDIIDKDGYIIGNIFENKELLDEKGMVKEKTNLIISEITGENWTKTHNEAIFRGCRHT